ncbi:conserved hypothetical protein [Culex quinquefasciatus]|uniref:Uncharacterized protein n=1 Tax=Culex quinquefasciatus TaxID=7176 RepID=B0W2D2_CULQU|nr:conserved hypothetical protein [Culex quinquefasciatus]|eukprot:XP_001842835.1 conserved hypothetical protein [Culex quinquefasciatus]
MASTAGGARPLTVKEKEGVASTTWNARKIPGLQKTTGRHEASRTSSTGRSSMTNAFGVVKNITNNNMESSEAITTGTRGHTALVTGWPRGGLSRAILFNQLESYAAKVNKHFPPLCHVVTTPDIVSVFRVTCPGDDPSRKFPRGWWKPPNSWVRVSEKCPQCRAGAHCRSTQPLIVTQRA